MTIRANLITLRGRTDTGLFVRFCLSSWRWYTSEGRIVRASEVIWDQEPATAGKV